MDRRISPAGLDFIKGYESLVLYVYDDKRAPVNGKYPEWDGSKPKGTLTIAYGHTNAAKHPLKISKGLRVTEAQALQILDVDLDECEADVNRTVKVPITQGQFDALVSFTFNCGPGNLANIVKRLNAGKAKEARDALALYNKSGGEYMRGLARRRAGEQELWDASIPDVPSEPVHHSAEVDAPAPVVTAAQAAAGAVVATAAVATATWWDTVSGWFSSIFGG